MTKKGSREAVDLMKKAFVKLQNVWKDVEQDPSLLTEEEYKEWVWIDHDVLRAMADTTMVGWQEANLPNSPYEEICKRFEEILKAFEARDLKQTHKLQMEAATWLIAKNDELLHIAFVEGEESGQ